ncbi:MAG: DUF1289 domain-containing protein [Gammaproteobacteria bacterium]|nr:DUF1289 domain-containing protein [Gammaproteobacteria bacterium]
MAEFKPESSVASPCVRNCCLDDQDICLGCFRSLAEIVGWGGANDAERRATLARAAERASQRKSPLMPPRW